MRYIINFWTEAGIACLYATDNEADFLKHRKTVIKEYRPEIARINFNENTTIFSFPDPTRKDTFNKWANIEYIVKPKNTILVKKSILKTLY